MRPPAYARSTVRQIPHPQVARSTGLQGLGRQFAAVIISGVLTGCASLSPSHYESPRVVGRVLDMTTQAPVKNVAVRRASSDSNTKPMDPPHGAGLMGQEDAVHTQADGTFVLNSLRSLSVLGSGGWYSVTLRFDASGYSSVTRTYTLANSTNTPSGEPMVDAGVILLPPRVK